MLVETRRNADGTKTLHWRQSQPNATYLMMVAAGEFTEIARLSRQARAIVRQVRGEPEVNR